MEKQRILRYFERLITEGLIPHDFPGTPEFAIECYQKYLDGEISGQIWQDLCNGIIEEIPERQALYPNIEQTNYIFDTYDYIKRNGHSFFSGVFHEWD